MKDLNEVLQAYGPDAVRELIDAARPYPVMGLYALADFPVPPPVTDLPVGIDGLDDLFRMLLDGVRLLILDPWNEIEHKRKPGETETDYVSSAIRMLKHFARFYECAVWLVAHPRKPQTDGMPKPPSLYDLAGSANFANKADYGVTVHRYDLAGNAIDVRLVKVRMGLPGKVGKVRPALDWRTMGYGVV